MASKIPLLEFSRIHLKWSSNVNAAKQPLVLFQFSAFAI
jgi:hypothetical protein